MLYPSLNLPSGLSPKPLMLQQFLQNLGQLSLLNLGTTISSESLALFPDPSASGALSEDVLPKNPFEPGATLSTEALALLPDRSASDALLSEEFLPSFALSPVEGRRMSEELTNSSTLKPEFVFNFPTQGDEFRSALQNILVSLNWVDIERTSKWLIAKYGKGKKTSLHLVTAYVQLYDKVVNLIEKDQGMCLIAHLQNTPGMPEDKDINVAFVQQLVAVCHVARQFGCILDESLLPSGLGTPPRVQTPSVGDSRLLSPCSVILRDIGSPELSPLVYRPSRPRSTKRKALNFSDESDDEISQAKGKHRPMVSPCRDVLTGVGSPQLILPSTPARMQSTRDIDHQSEAAKTPRGEGKQGSMLSLDGSDLDSPPPTGKPGAQMVNKKLKAAGLHCSKNVKRLARTEVPLLVTLEDAMKSKEYSEDHIDNNCNNMARIMTFYAGDPYKFELQDLTDIGTLHRLSSALQDAGASSNTKSHYMGALSDFLDVVKKSHRQSHPHLMPDLELVRDEVSAIKRRAGKGVRKEKTEKIADHALTKDDSQEIVQRFNQAVETKLRPIVREVFHKYKDGGKAVCPSDLRKANVFFISQFVKYGHRPVVFGHFPYSRYLQAKNSDPISSPDLAHLGPYRYLITTEHKTGSEYVAFVPLPIKEEWVWLSTYIKFMRPAPSEKDKKYLFLNSNGHCIKNVCGELKGVMKNLDLSSALSPREIRHAISTLAFGTLEGKERENVSTAMCHKPNTQKVHYVDSITQSATNGLGHICRLISGKSKSYAPSSQEVLTNAEPVSLKQYRPVTESDGCKTSVVGERSSSGLPSAPRSERAARQHFISQCFSIAADRALPSEDEFEEAKSRHAAAYPEIRETPYKKFNESCRASQNKLRAETVVADTGRQRFKNVRESLKKELKDRKWDNVKTLDHAVSLYERKMETGGRRPQLVTGSVATGSSKSTRPAKGSLIDDHVAKSIRTQEWQLAKVSENEKGKGLFARCEVKKGTIVCDYHGERRSYAEGHKKYKDDESSANRYMYCFQHGPVWYYMDSNDKHCKCHPKTVLKGRLINHSSSNPNLKPRIDELDGRPVILFQAIRDIGPFEEFLFDYQCHGDPHSHQEGWMKK